MKTYSTIAKFLFASILIFTIVSCNRTQEGDTGSQNVSIDIIKERKAIEGLTQQFSKDFQNKDSVALASHYASDGSLGSVKGKDNLISAWGQMIRNRISDGTANMTFTINSLSTDGEFLAELGVFEFRDDDNQVKHQGKYLVVWKREDGEWKIYKDMGL